MFRFKNFKILLYVIRFKYDQNNLTKLMKLSFSFENIVLVNLNEMKLINYSIFFLENYTKYFIREVMLTK